MIEKGITDGICQATHRNSKANNKCMKITIKTLSHHI